MIKRFFAFGCSYTRYAYMTWADIIGVNYEEYHNYGAPGASNTFIMNRLVEVNDACKFDSETDYVMVMLTGFGRFSYVNNPPQWHHKGDLHSYYHNTKDPIIKYFLDKMWSEDWAVYQSWIATKIIKDLLVVRNIPHKILMGIDNSLYTHTTEEIKQDSVDKANEIYNVVDIKMTIDEWRRLNPENNDSPYWKNLQKNDGHPSPNAYLKYLKENLPEFVTDKSLDELANYNRIFDNSSQQNQQINFDNTFIKEFNSKKVSVFGW